MNKDTLYRTVEVHRHSTANALYFRRESIPFPLFLRRVDEMADKLYRLGVRKGTVVSLLSPNVPECIVALYALSKIGATMSLLHPLLPKEVLRRSLEETHSDVLLILDVLWKNYEGLNLPRTYFLSALPDLEPVARLFFPLLYRKELRGLDKERYLHRIAWEKADFDVNEDADAGSILLRSGGTTGRSKTVVCTEHGISFVTRQSEEILCHECRGHSMIGVLPVFHGFGLAMGIHAPLSNEAASCLMINYDGREIVSKIRQNKLNVLLTIPYMTDKLLRQKGFSGRKLRNLLSTFIGADKPELSLFQRFDERMKEAQSVNRLLEGYGLTETITVNFVNTLRDNRIGSVGKPLQGVRLRIADEADLSRDKGDNQVGRILISSESVCLGYLDTPEEKQPFHVDADGTRWLVTGDVGYRDEDGFLFFVNRERDVVKIAGYNVFPSEIEKEANAYPGVLTSAAVPIEDRRHPYVVLFVQREGKEGKEEFAKGLRTYLQDRLIRYAVPEKILLVDHFPRTDIGKIDRKKLKEGYLAGK